MVRAPDENERIEFYFPRRIGKLLREVIPSRERSRFVAEATERELKRKLFADRLNDFARLDVDTCKPVRRLRWKRLKTSVHGS